MRIFQADAFTRTRFTGNPATVILGADRENEAALAAIAREFAHAETVFALEPDAADHDVRMRFFNVRKEAAFVGHATVAAHAVLLAHRGRAPGTLRQKSGTGILEVTAARGESAAEAFVEFRQTAPALDPDLPLEAVVRVAGALGLPRDLLDARLPARIARKGSSRLLLAVTGEQALNRLEPRFDELLKLGKELGTEGFFAFCVDRGESGLRTRSRMFCPALGIPEDPVSGNAHAMLAAHLLDLEVLSPADQRFTGYQGEQMRRPGCVQVTPEILDGKMVAARIGGHAVIVSEGRFV
jgi:PhzF family phenazine biosynthesis protein